MTPEPMPETERPEDERFVYAVTAARVEALRESAAAFDSEQEPPPASGEQRLDAMPSAVRDEPDRANGAATSISVPARRLHRLDLRQ
jgi:hypothetical protein